MALELPTPRDCPAILGVGASIVGGLVGLLAIVAWDVRPWGFVLLALSGWVAFTSVIVCLAWEWDRF